MWVGLAISDACIVCVKNRHCDKPIPAVRFFLDPLLRRAGMPSSVEAIMEGGVVELIH
eukprot:COSAG01_NODE_3165_length_6476_cov_31.556845_6_plen_58_part_00